MYRSDFVAPIEFLPLLPRETVTRLTFTSPDLGVFLYDLKLLASPAPPERSIHFKVGLGGYQTQVFRFLSHCKSKTEYACKIENPDFSVEKTVSVPAGMCFILNENKNFFIYKYNSWARWYRSDC